MMPPRLRLLHVIASVGPVHGGPSLMVHEMAAGLVAAGHRAEVATTDDNGERRLDVPLDGALERDGVVYRHFERQWRAGTSSLPLARWLRGAAGSYDVLHVHGLFSHPTTAAARAAQRARVPYVVRPLGALQPWGMAQGRRHLKRFLLRFVDGPLLAAAAAVHFTSAEERDQAAAAGVPGRPVVVPLGIRLPPTSSASGQSWLRVRHPDWTDRVIVLFLSRIHPKKGLDLLLPAFADVRARHPRAALLLAGDGEPDYLRALAGRAADLGVARHVRFAGHLSGPDKQGAFAAADLFVLPSRAENFGVAAVEALGAGCPVLVSTAVPLAAAVREARAGWAAVPERAQFTAALDRALATPAVERRAMGERGRALAVARWSRDRMVADLVELYQRLATPRAGRT
ncbi:MAG: glycosyltransferase [Gemmatimonadota bacterium]